MNKKSGKSKDAADKLVKGIKRKTRKQYSAEEKIRIVLAGLRGEGIRPARLPLTFKVAASSTVRVRRCG